ncbi:hypothetical protein [Elioraea rosea]|uniref:hypothetical protein n=1 Tax=Elioraea rosea TaxID=2492390 RepID=UPI0011824AFA|nr:hypothetical protein [Elioraea rosea]
METPSGARSVRDRARSELRSYLLLSAYLFICFVSILGYRAAVLAEHGLHFAPLGIAAVKALVLAKFILLGHMLRLGATPRTWPLAIIVLYRSGLFLLLLLALSVVEEVIRGALDGLGPAMALREATTNRGWELAATVILLWLILLPYFGISGIRERLGEPGWRRLVAADHPGPPA